MFSLNNYQRCSFLNKAADIASLRRKTGEGGCTSKLSEEETRIVALMGNDVVEGRKLMCVG